jgi:hypothetical protein
MPPSSGSGREAGRIGQGGGAEADARRRDSSATNPAQAPLVRELAAAASALGLTLDSFPIRDPTNVQLSFTAIARTGAQAGVVLPGACDLSLSGVDRRTRRTRAPSDDVRVSSMGGGRLSHGLWA